MQKEELDIIIKTLEINNPTENAKVGIYYINHEDESYVKANKAGLELLAVELLKASSRVEEIERGEIETLYINIKKNWIDNQTSLMFIHPVTNFEPNKIEEVTFGLKYYATKYGCMILIGIAIISCIIGLFTIFKWLL